VITPTQEYQRTSCQAPERLLKGADATVNSWIGRFHRRSQITHDLQQEAEKIAGLRSEVAHLSDHDLQERLREFRVGWRRGGRAERDLLWPSLAAIREAARRQVGLHPFPVQLMGALALHRGYLAEMATGEGKTLTAGLAAVLAGWTRRPCHIITVNDYLVQRDAEWLKPLYSFCGVRVGFVTAKMEPADRRHGYDCDVTYVTSKEVLADFLRDRLQIGDLKHPARRLIRRLLTPQLAVDQRLVLRGLHTAIVDEADSILIDEAVTPLIISTQHKNDALRDVVQLAQQIVEPFEPELDYRVNQRYREIELTPEGQEKLASRCASLHGIWRGTDRRLELVRQALLAREFYLPGKQYVVSEDGKIIIVDEFTGRPMPQRSWRQGMHQAIEAKEKVSITDPAETVARLSFQRYFRLYYRLSGMTGTAREAAGEFWYIYRLPVIRIPTNKPCIRVQWPDRLFPDESSKWTVVVEEIETIHQSGRPLLVGTRSVAASERLAAMLTERGLYFNLLNAVRHQEEAAVVANAGLKSQITIATNMAGRGTDIKLGPGVAGLGGLHVIATERHESGRVDRQLFGRSARQGDPGTAQAFVSAEDELLRRYLPPSLQRTLTKAIAGRFPARQKLGEAAFALAQRRAQRLAYHQRRTVLRTDDWLEEALSFTGSSGT
jgi:preprotein translocase subunit SecA